MSDAYQTRRQKNTGEIGTITEGIIADGGNAAVKRNGRYIGCISPPGNASSDCRTCTQSGTIRKACTICGATTAESIPANGHHYSESVTQPTCAQNGHTTHTCSVCGNSYTDTETPALGHDWEAHEEEQAVIGSEVHCFCSVCGMDFTASGMGNGVDHQKAHALPGEGSGCYSTLIPIYGTVTTYTCRRCGTTK